LKKLSCAVGIISKIRYKLNQKSSLLLYDTLVLSHLTYCNIVWASTYKSSLTKIYSLQRRVLKICRYTYKVYNISIFKFCNRLSIYDLNKMSIAKFVFSAVHNTLPACFANYFVNLSEVHHHRTRQSNKLFLNYAKTNIRRFSISIAGPSLWNSIPENFKSLSSLYLFVKNYKIFLLDKG